MAALLFLASFSESHADENRKRNKKEKLLRQAARN